jgi:hypothetical protein
VGAPERAPLPWSAAAEPRKAWTLEAPGIPREPSCFVVLVVLGFELVASGLLGRRCIT